MKLGVIEAEITQPAEVIEENLVDRFGEVAIRDSERIWGCTADTVFTELLPAFDATWYDVVRESGSWFQNACLDFLEWVANKYRIEVELDVDAGRVTVTKTASDRLYHLCLLMTILFPLPIVLDVVVYGGSAPTATSSFGAMLRSSLFIMVGFIYFDISGIVRGPELERILADGTVTTNWSVHPLSYWMFLLAVLLLTYPFAIMYSIFIIPFVWLPLVGFVLVMAYQDNALPGVTVGTGRLMLAIPLMAMLAWATFVTSFLAAVVFLHDVAASSFADRYVEMMELSRTSTGTSRGLWIGKAALVASIMWMILFYLLILEIFSISKRLAETLKHVRLAQFHSRLSRMVVFAGYVSTGAVFLLSVFFGATIILYGLTDTVLLPVSNRQASTLLETNYTLIDRLTDTLPIFPARAYTVGYYIALLLPLSLITSGWLFNIGDDIRTKVRIRRNGAELDHDALPSDVDLIVLDWEDRIVVNPVTWFLGMQQSVLISRPVVELLSEEELEAVLMHELYHLKNRDLLVNALASIFAVLFGGRNALLAFYDYPKVEREADLFAVDKTGAQPLVRALRKLDNASATASELPVGTPGFVSEAHFEPESETYEQYDLLLAALRYWLRDTYESLIVAYHLFFGRVLLDVTHLDVEERIQYITDEE